MGLPVPANAPQITVGGRTFGVGAFVWNTPDGTNYVLGVFEQKAGQWEFLGNPNYIAMYVNPNEMVADMKSKGGCEAWFAWFKTAVNKQLATLAPIVPPTTEPETDDEAIAWVGAKLAAMKLTIVNGVPVLS